MQIGLISLFPNMFEALHEGITGRALKNKLLTLHHWNPRDYSIDKHRRVDDEPYGGGPGMVMSAQPLRDTIIAAKKALPSSKVIYLTPQGEPLKQMRINQFAKRQELIFLAGRYEGVDERIIETLVDEQYSIGDYVLSGGELAAMVIIDAIIRQLPGALGDSESAKQDSFMQGLLDCPHYTRPACIDNKKVPEILLSGNHNKIRRWRHKQSLGRTWRRRSDLLENINLTQEQKTLLDEFIQEHKDD